MRNPLIHGRKIAKLVERALGGLGLAAFTFPKVTLTLVAIASALSLWAASRLRVDADLAELLPRTFPSLQAFDVLKQRFGGIGFVVVTGTGGEPDTLRRFAKDVTDKVSGLSTVRYVDYLRPTEFFKTHAGYFLDVEDLEKIQSTLADRLEWEKKNANPMYVDLEETEPPSLEFTDVQKKYAGRGDRRWVSAQIGEEYYLDAKNRLVAVFVKPAQSSTDLTFTRKLVDEVKKAVGTLDMKKYPGVSVGFTGTYPKRIDQQEIIDRDLRVATLVAFFLIMGYFLLHFRQVSTMIVGLLPMVVGTFWTYGYSGAAFGILNILTSFIGAIIMGIGNDHGVHLLGRYKAEMVTGQPVRDAIRTTFGHTGRAALVSAVTTCVGFGGLSLSQFRAFREFGAIAAVGGILMVFAYIITLPALMSVALRFGWKIRLQESERSTPLVGILQRRATGILVTAAFVVVGCTLLVRQVSFNYDFNSLGNSDLESFRLDTKVNRLLGYSQTPMVILTDSLAEEHHAAEALRAGQTALGKDSTIDFIVAGSDLVPEEQARKQPILAAIGEDLNEISPKRLAADQRPLLDAAKKMTAAAPFGRADLPNEVRRQFQGVNSLANQGFVLAFPSIPTSDGHAVMRMAGEIRAIRSLDGKPYSIAGEALILADILTMVTGEAPVVVTLTVLATFLAALLLMGRLRDTAMALGPTVVTMAVTLGLLPLMDLQLNYLNIILIPFLFGYGIESGAHLVTRFSADPDLGRVLPPTGRAVVASLATTAFGFGAMLVAVHPGLRSLALLALVGLGANMLACVVVLPSFFVWLRRRRRAPVGAAAKNPDKAEAAEA